MFLPTPKGSDVGQGQASLRQVLKSRAPSTESHRTKWVRLASENVTTWPGWAVLSFYGGQDLRLGLPGLGELLRPTFKGKAKIPKFTDTKRRSSPKGSASEADHSAGVYCRMGKTL